MDKLAALLCLKELKGNGVASINRLCASFTATAIPDEKNEIMEWIRKVLPKYSKDEIDSACNAAYDKLDYILSQSSFKAVTIYDQNYPEQLLEMGMKKPIILYYMGNLDLLKIKSISVIGTRHPSDYSMRISRLLIREMASSMVNVVSGLANGCDMIAHNEAINANGKTIAVLPCGFENITPARNKKLFQDIIKSDGLAITEYFPTKTSSKYTFVERDRIVAGISEATIVMECKKESGTMHTVNYALEYGRRIGCIVPSENGYRELFEGNYYLIDEKKAKGISSIEGLKIFIEECNADTKDEYEQISFDFL